VLRFVQQTPAEILSLLKGLVHLINRDVAVNYVIYAF
jgi:hypothetical protein